MKELLQLFKLKQLGIDWEIRQPPYTQPCLEFQLIAKGRQRSDDWHWMFVITEQDIVNDYVQFTYNLYRAIAFFRNKGALSENATKILEQNSNYFG